jgi:salicylate hydroxylase
MVRTEILVVGGGIGGLSVALGLARRGRTVHVIEKAPEFGEIGAGLQLAPNASWALDRIGVLDEVKKHAVFPQRLLWMDAMSGERLTALDCGEGFVKRYGYPYMVMHRSDLLDAILAGCRSESRITLETNKDVVGVVDRESSAVVTCADGSSYEAGIVIGADGLRSTVRSIVHSDGEPICSAYVAYRGTLPIGEMSEHAGFDSVIVWTGPDLHLVQYPVRRGELYNQVAVFRSAKFVEGVTSGTSDEWGTPDEMDAKFAPCVPLVRAGIAKMGRTRRWPMFDRLPIHQWTRNRIVLTGDAAHPMLQYLAQGAAQALEDSAVLADAIVDQPDVTRAFAAFQDERAPRTTAVQTMAREWGDYWHLHDGPMKASRDARLRLHVDDDYSDTDWFYGYRGPVDTLIRT